MAEEDEVSLANEEKVEDVTSALQAMTLEVEAAGKGDSLIAIMRTWHQKGSEFFKKLTWPAGMYGSDVMDKLITKKINVAGLT